MGQRIARILSRIPCFSGDVFHDEEPQQIKETKEPKDDSVATPSPIDPNTTVYVVVMGSTGSGKTTFINLASGSELRVGSGLESCTNEVQTSIPFKVGGKQVVLLDTPGFDDTSMTDTDVLRIISAYLVAMYEQGAKLAGIIYMHRISDFRMSGTSKRNFRIFRELCGESTLNNVLIVTNMWGNVDSKTGEERERELATNDKLFKPVLEKGARLLRHDNTEASAHAILRNLINNQTAILAIQHEIVNQRKGLAQTAAGSELTRLLKEQAQRYGDEITNLRGEVELATRAKDEARKELQEEVERKQLEIERIQRDVGRMATDFLVERSRLESRIAEMEAENRRYLANLKDLQDEVNNVRKEAESMQIEHARRKSELLTMQREEAENKARFLEEERRAREQVEAQYRKEIDRVQEKRLHGQNFLAKATRDPVKITDGTSSSSGQRDDDIRP
ncbi:P-loop containing nucleoside triphosphate hydrolase protein [Pisolithus croceorrhizus]|nr:P-loop containing nucleoside triphosphate hydrolase protein [Pisolithus croceorrhizus]